MRIPRRNFLATSAEFTVKADLWVTAGLIALSLVPIAAGAMRLAELASGAEITPENARFFAAPLPVVVHILSTSFYLLLGAFQFSPASAAGESAGTAMLGGCWFPSDFSPHYRVCG